jgi:hypothetical protein
MLWVFKIDVPFSSSGKQGVLIESKASNSFCSSFSGVILNLEFNFIIWEIYIE